MLTIILVLLDIVFLIILIILIRLVNNQAEIISVLNNDIQMLRDDGK